MIEISHASFSYGTQTVLENCNIHVPSLNHVALIGPSGCGKTTLLHAVAGLVKPKTGVVTVRAHRIACVFQEPRLLDWLTALENVNVVLSDRPETKDLAQYWLEKVGLAEAAQKYPRELSGGMRQRIAICRALAYDPDLLLMDEPLKGFDAALYEKMSELLKEFSKHRTLLLVTHVDAEARALAEEMLVYTDRQFIPESI